MIFAGLDLHKKENCPMRNEPERGVRFQCEMSLKLDLDSNAG